MSRARRKKKQQRQQVVNVQNALGVDAAALSYDRNFNLWPVLNPQQEVSDWQLDRIYRRARSLYANYPEVRAVVKEIVNLQGYLTPFAATSDEEWNDLAREAFLRRCLNPKTFDVSGRLNFYQAQAWMETRAIIDGDCLVVMASSYDGGGMVKFYSAPQICGEDAPENSYRSGVECYPSGRVKKYIVKDFDKDIFKGIPAYTCCLYGHEPSPLDPRHPSELIAAVTTAQDIYEINSLHKQQIKVASYYGIVETKDLNDKRSGLSDIVSARRGNQTPAEPEPPLVIDGVKAISLMPGRRLETLRNNNPSNEVRAFVTERRDALALAFGLDPIMLFDSAKMGSASARYALAKTKDFSDKRNIDRIVYCNKIWMHIIAGEVAAGRLRPCRDTENAYKVNWINRAEWSIDLRHDASTFISLINAGLAEPNQWTLSHYGKTAGQLLEERARYNREVVEVADRYGISPDALAGVQPGAAPVSWEQTAKE